MMQSAHGILQLCLANLLIMQAGQQVAGGLDPHCGIHYGARGGGGYGIRGSENDWLHPV